MNWDLIVGWTLFGLCCLWIIFASIREGRIDQTEQFEQTDQNHHYFN